MSLCASLLTDLDERHLEGFAGAVLLEAIGKGEGFVHFVGLKDVEAAIQADLPAVIGHDVTRVQAAGRVELDPLASLDGEPQQRFDLLAVRFAVREQDLDQARKRLVES